MKSGNRKRLIDLEPRESNDDVRGGRLALASSSVKFDLSSPGGAVFAFWKVENGVSFKQNLGAFYKVT